MKRNRRCVSKVFVSVFMLSAIFFVTSCATTGGASYFSEKNAKKRLKSEYKIEFTNAELATQIRFSKDGKMLLIPPYQEMEKVFGYDSREMESLNSDTGDAFWVRLNKIIDREKMNMYAFQAARMYNWNGCVLYALYVADFINTYQAKCPKMINMETAPEWFKQLLAERRANPSFAMNEEQLEISALRVNVTAKNRSAQISWTTSDLIKGVQIEYFNFNKEDGYKNRISKVIKNKKQTSLVLKNLENYTVYQISFKFFDKDGEPVRGDHFKVTPCTGNKAKDYIKSSADFTDKNAYKFLTPEYKLALPWRFAKKISFSEDGKYIFFPRKWQKSEAVFNYTKEAMKYDDFAQWGRLNGVIEGNVFANFSANEYSGNVRWLLSLVDFMNLYEEKCPSLIDLRNAPKWFKDLMAERKKSGKSFVKDSLK